MGRLFQNAVRKSDVVSRFGGEEFAWIIHGEDVEKIFAVLDRFRMKVCNSEFPKNIHLSVSTGLTPYYPHSHDTTEKLIDRADKALYQAKGNGKNRVEVLVRNEDHEQSKK
jgi:diguanylate cyclase